MANTEGERLPKLILRRETMKEELAQLRSDFSEKARIYREEIQHAEQQILDCAKNAAQLTLPLE